MRVIPILSNQRLYTTDSPTFAGLTITNACVLGSNSAVFQPNTDATTFFQILDADGGTPVFNVDTSNERVGVGVADPDTTLEVYKVGTQLKLSGGAGDYATFAVAADGALTITTVDLTAAEGDIILAPDGCVGIFDTAPGTMLQLKGADAYITLQNSSAENSEGGCETRLICEDHDNNALAQVEGSHSGTADDYKGKLILSTNTGSALTAALTISDTQLATFASNILIPDAGYIGAASATTAIQIEADGDILLSGKIGTGITPAAPIHGYIAATTASTPLEVLRLECKDNGVELDAGMGAAINFYMPEDSASFLGAAIAARKESNVDTAESTNLIFSTCPDAGSSTVRMRIGDGGEVGIGLDVDAGTLLQLALDGNAYITLQNLTAENSEGGCETRIIFEDHAANALMQIEGSHSGSADDAKGKIIISTNSGSGLATALTITDTLAATFAGAIGSTNFEATNKLTACASNAGELDFTASSKKLDVEDSAVVSQDYTSDSATVTFAALGLTADGAALTLKNSQNEHGEGGAETLIKFTDHTNAVLAQVQGAHSGTSDDTKGKMLISVHSGSSLSTAITIVETLAVTFAGAISATNYTAANLLTACATNAGEIDFTGSSKKLDVEDNSVVNQDLTTDASPGFANVGLSTGELTCGSINRGAGTLTLEIGGTAEISITSTTSTFGGNILIPDAGQIGSASDTNAITISATGEVDITAHNLATTGLKLAGTLITASAAEINLLDGQTACQEQGDILDDLNTLGAPTADGEFIVATAAGAFAYETTTTAATSLALGTGNTVQHAALKLGTANLKSGALFELAEDAANAELVISCYHDTEATTPLITMRKGEGTEASHASAVDDNTVLGTIIFQGYDSNSWANGVKIEARIKGAPADGDMPAELTFWTTADGGSETPVERVTIGPGGTVDIIAHDAATVGLALAGTLVTSTAAELNLLDGVTAVQEQGDVLDDLNTLGAVGADSEFLVGTGAGALAWENAATARTSLGVGTGDSPAFTAVSLGTGELTAGSINRAADSLLLEIGGTPELSISATASTFGGNILIPDAGYIGSASATTAIQIEADGDLLVANKLGIDITPAAPLHIKIPATTGTSPLEVLRLECKDEGVDLAIGMGPAIHFYYPHDAASQLGATISCRKLTAPDTGTAPELVFTTAGTMRMRILNSGFVGIGDDVDPGTLLQLDDANAYITLHNITDENGEGGAETRIIFEDHANNALAQIEGSHSGVGDDAKGKFTISTNSGAGLAAAITILDTINVGIGVTDPDELLELYKVGTQLKLSGGAADYATFAVAADGALTITTVDDTAAAGDICLMPDGKVGINDAAPGEMLDVDGNANVTGVYKVDDVQVVTSQQVHIADATTQDLAGSDTIDETKLEADLTAICGVINNILSMVEAHGLTAAA